MGSESVSARFGGRGGGVRTSTLVGVLGANVVVGGVAAPSVLVISVMAVGAVDPFMIKLFHLYKFTVEHVLVVGKLWSHFVKSLWQLSLAAGLYLFSVS